MFFSEVDEAGVRRQADELPRPHPDLQQRRHSYRDLPIRLAEQGLVHRYERCGVTHGLVRVRSSRRTTRTLLPREQIEAEIGGC